jgi:pimeloyl-ACP methyl ester carboxylesterase
MQTTLRVGDGNVALNYQLAKHMVVFSHGFGVRNDARGMFTDIAQALPKDWGYALFDYDGFDETSRQQKVVGFAARVQRLQTVLEWVQAQDGVEKVSIVGHSIGALTIANLAPEHAASIVLIAPPLSLGSRFAEQFTKRADARHDGHTWFIPRADGTITVVDDEVLAELMNVDAEGELAKLALFRPYAIILAGVDEVIPDADYTELITMPSVTMEGVDRANHDFDGTARAELVTLVLKQLMTVS